MDFALKYISSRSIKNFLCVDTEFCIWKHPLTSWSSFFNCSIVMLSILKKSVLSEHVIIIHVVFTIFPRKRISFYICHTGSNIQRSYVDHCLFPRISKDLLQTYCMRLCIMPNMSIVSNHIKVMSITCTMCQYGFARQIRKICAYNLNCVIYDTLSTSSF